MPYLSLGLGLARVSGKASTAANKNLLFYTQEFDAGAWIKSGLVVASDTVADPPPGGTTADALTSSVANGTISQTVNIIRTSVRYSFSIYMKAPSNQNVNIDLIAVGGSTFSSVANLTTQWQRFYINPSIVSGITQLTAQIRGIASGQTIHLFGAQLERKANPTNYSRRVAT